jgi:diaminopimelate epimerase
VETLAGIRTADVLVENGVAVGARCDMGRVFGDERDVTVRAAGRDWSLRRVDVGSKHGVALLDAQPEDALFFEAGPLLERAEAYPDRANIEFVTREGPDALRMRVRGEGLRRNPGLRPRRHGGLCGRVAEGLGGAARHGAAQGRRAAIEWGEGGHVIMEGPATFVFSANGRGLIQRSDRHGGHSGVSEA